MKSKIKLIPKPKSVQFHLSEDQQKEPHLAALVFSDSATAQNSYNLIMSDFKNGEALLVATKESSSQVTLKIVSDSKELTINKIDFDSKELGTFAKNVPKSNPFIIVSAVIENNQLVLIFPPGEISPLVLTGLTYIKN